MNQKLSELLFGKRASWQSQADYEAGKPLACGCYLLAIFAGLALLVFLTSCSPYAGLQITTATATPTPSPTTSEVTTATPEKLCTVSTGYDNGRLNLRTGPGVEHVVITTLGEGQQLTVIQERDGWLYVRPGTTIPGWVNGKFCRKEN